MHVGYLVHVIRILGMRMKMAGWDDHNDEHGDLTKTKTTPTTDDGHEKKMIRIAWALI